MTYPARQVLSQNAMSVDSGMTETTGRKISDALCTVRDQTHYPLEVMLVCARWYVAYPLSIQHLEQMMHERGVFVDQSTVHRWALKILPIVAISFRWPKRPVGTRWRMDVTSITVAGQWKCLYRAVDKGGDTVDFLLTAKRDLAGARRYLERAIELHDLPEKTPSTKTAM